MKINERSDSSNALHEQILDAFLDGQQLMTAWDPEIERQNNLIALGPGSIDFDIPENQSAKSHYEGEENKRRYYSPPLKRNPNHEKDKSSNESIASDEYKQIQLAIELSICDEKRRRSGIDSEEIASRTGSDEEMQKAIEFSIIDERKRSLQRSIGEINMIEKKSEETEEIALAIQLSMQEVTKEELDLINRRLKKGKGLNLSKI
jgi:hypothetical protein